MILASPHPKNPFSSKEMTTNEDTLIQLYFFRHGETDWNVQQRFQGHKDIPLNPIGRIQAQALGPILKEKDIQAILTSDLLRTLETAEIITESIHVPLFKSQALREAHLGEAEGMTRYELEEKFGKTLYQKWHSPQISDADIAYPKGETGNQVLKRAIEEIKSFVSHHSFKKIGVSTHGGVIRRILNFLSPSEIPIPFIKNGAVYLITYDPRSDYWMVKS